MRLAGKVALVTGSSGGIGQAIAAAYGKEGAKVVINYSRNLDGANETLAQVEAAGGEGFVLKADVGSVAEVKQMVNESISHFGQLDILVNNAGVEKNAAFWDVTEEDYDKVLDTNLKGVFFTTQAFVQHLMATKRPGRIVNISSTHEDMAFPNFTAYCCSKGGIRMLTRNLCVELGPHGITINNIAPGAIETPINRKLLNDPTKLNSLVGQIPLGRLGQTSDVAGLAVFLGSDEAAYVTGSTYFVDGGLSQFYQEQ